jgi:hypothetical protein
MRKNFAVFLAVCFCIGISNAATRTQNALQRSEMQNVSARQSSNAKNTNVSRTTTTRSNITPRNDAKKTISRTATKKTVSSRPTNNRNILTTRTAKKNTRVSRAATTQTKTFSDNYNTCRDAYFTCMDLFCANQNEQYRRCVCSSRLYDIQNQEKKLSKTADSLQDFQDLNIDAISKTASEVKAMGSASEGEQMVKKKGKSDGTGTLKNISDILKNTKQKKLSTGGTLDIAGDIEAIWSTTDLINGTNLANLTGESLYNAVHTQCAELVAPNCEASDLKMIVSAYGMYIENDCSILANNLDKKTTDANAAIRTTRHQMQDARLENYDAHNSLSLNDCIAKVREDLTAPTACGQNYVHCLDFTGKYLNSTTGEPIYSPDFYQIENQLSLSGDILKNTKNVQLVKMLNAKRIFAKNSLDLCTDDADYVWDEFLRQSITEIYQLHQQSVQKVKSDCLRVVNECYLKQSDTLKAFSDNSYEIMLGQALELSEELCSEKLNTCSNLYGGGPEGLALLVNTLAGITDQSIAQECPALLATFAQKICAVPTSDPNHNYPYGCRVYAPGEARYSRAEICNTTLVNPFSKSDILNNKTSDINNSYYICPNARIRYKSCEFNHYLYYRQNNNIDCSDSNYWCYDLNQAEECRICPTGYLCAGGTSKPQNLNQNLYDSCGLYYIGSLYQQLVIYALQNCTRPSNDDSVLPESILADVDIAMKNIQTSLVISLSTECDSHNGTWVDIPWTDEDADGYHDVTGDKLLNEFYTSTGTNKLWGYCK